MLFPSTVHLTGVEQEYTEQMRWLVDVAYPEGEDVCVVRDNLNTHTPGVLYEAFARSADSSSETH